MTPEVVRLALWGVLIGLLLIGMALSSSYIKRLPLSEAMIYLLVGYGLSSSAPTLLRFDIQAHIGTLTHLTEAALLVSLFSAGLKLHVPWRDVRWRLSLRLAVFAMLITVALMVALGMTFGLPVGIALLIGAALAPTDPVLASDVQVENSGDRDKLRFSLTGESGVNDGVALPLIVLALGLQRDQPFSFWQWLGIDVLWSISGGIAIGALVGTAIAHLVLYLRTRQKHGLGLDEFLVLGVLALSWGAALLCWASPFLAVFSAGLAMSRVTLTSEKPARLPAHELDQAAELATHPAHAGPLMIRAVLGFNEQLERLAEITVVILVGALLPMIEFGALPVFSTLALLLLIRPLAVNAAIAGIPVDRAQRRLLSWFGIRGIGSIYYLLYALQSGIAAGHESQVISVVLLAVATSIVVHGISVTPLMRLYAHRAQHKSRRL